MNYAAAVWSLTNGFGQEISYISGTDTSRGTTTQPTYSSGIVKRQKNKVSINFKEGKTITHYKGTLTTEGIIIQQYLYKNKSR